MSQNKFDVKRGLRSIPIATLKVCRRLNKRPNKQAGFHRSRPNKLIVKWSGKTGQRAKMYPTRATGYTNDQERKFFGQV